LGIGSTDPTRKHKSIDLNFIKAKRVFEGVYVVERDTLKICVNRQTEGVKERPPDFKTLGKPDRSLFVFQRTKTGAGMEGVSGFIGVALRKDISVAFVIEGSAAEKAGLKKDDTLIKIGEGAAADMKSAIELIRQARPGSALTI